MNRSVEIRRIRSVAVGSACLALCAGCGAGTNTTQSVPPNLLDSCPTLNPQPAPVSSLGAIVDGRVATEMQSHGLPGMTIEIAKNGAVLYARSYGYAALAPTCVAAQVDTEYQIGSVTKQFTAAAIVQLQSTGLLNIDNAAVTYLQGYSIDPRITLRMLLNQTSGLADYTDFAPPAGYVPSAALAEGDVLTAIAQAPLIFPPGSAYSYSNSNYFILGAIIEAVSSQSYADYLAQHIFRPAGLVHTYTTQPDAAALPYTYTYPKVPSATGLAAGIITDPSFYFAAGELWSNVQDLTTWNAGLRDGAIISASQLTAMVTPPAQTPVYQQPGTPSYYAMGLAVESQLGHPAVWHNGQTLAYTAFNEMFLDDGFSVSILTNVDTQEDTPLLPFADSLIRAICTAPETAGDC